ncbi:MAG: hypothetical protein IKJ29_06105 [Akkermansia sp.]|nr:hypothetical protein [Akkermansia sp.]
MLDFNAALEASGRPKPDRSFLDTAIDATDINQDAPRQLEPVVNPMQRLADVCLYNEDEDAAGRVKDDVLVTETARGDVFGQNMLIGVELADMYAGGDVYETAQRFIGALPREQQQAWRDKLNHCHTQSDGQALVGEMFRNGVVEQYRTNKARQEALEEAITAALPQSTKITWKEFFHVAQNQEKTLGQKLTYNQKKNIYSSWQQSIEEQEEQKKRHEQYLKRKKQKKQKKASIIIAASLPLLIMLSIIHKKRHIIYQAMSHCLRPFPLIISALLVLAICPLPYGYYQFLRIATTIWGITSLCVTCDQSPKNPNFSLIAIISGGIAILYNPLIPVHLTKDIWTILNLGSIPCILLSTYLTHSHRTED